MLSCAALDAALEATKIGELLYSESLTVRERALVGKHASTKTNDGTSSNLQWNESTSRQRVLEVMGRMEGGQPGLLEKLLLHGV